MNAMAATAVAIALQVPLDTIAHALNAFEGVNGRLAGATARNGARIINDSYNANPQSLYAGLQVLAAEAVKTGAGSWLVLGDMAELGEEAAGLHAAAGRQARKAGIDHLLATGELSRYAVDAFGAGGRFFADRQALVDFLAAQTGKDDVVLVKGSRSMRMDEIVAALVAADNNNNSQGTH
jgi:UDP-N-acetylmuramoyl-tripeptide--D-alanyl-D-alanine ligase